MDDKQTVELKISSEAKAEYLRSLIGKLHKILHLFEERKETGFSPALFISGQLFEINAANSLFDGKLIPIIVKVKGIQDAVDTIGYVEVKKQIFEAIKIAKFILKDICEAG